MGTTYKGLRVDEDGDRLVVTLDRPEVRNAIDAAMADGLRRVCAELERDPGPRSSQADQTFSRPVPTWVS